MPSVHPITNKQRKDYEFRISEAAQKQSFRQQPESGTVFAVTVSLTSLDPNDGALTDLRGHISGPSPKYGPRKCLGQITRL